MNNLIVVSFITHREHLIDEYEAELAAVGIDSCFHPVHLPNATYSITARWKLTHILEMCDRFSSYSRIIFSDGWDVYFVGTRHDLHIPSTPLISAERNCYPDPSLASQISGDTPWRFPNAGMVSGAPADLVSWAARALTTPDVDEMEQLWMNRRLAAGDFPIPLDSATSLFYTVSPDEDGSLKMRDHRPWNSVCGTYPQFFHFSGRCPVGSFQAMLQGRSESLCESA